MTTFVSHHKLLAEDGEYSHEHHQSRMPFLLIGVFLIIALIIYGVVISIWHSKKSGPFARFVPPSDVNFYHPSGLTDEQYFTPLTTAQITKRDKMIADALTKIQTQKKTVPVPP